jgi:hypothetical protein
MRPRWASSGSLAAPIRNQDGLAQALALLHGTQPRPASPIVALSTMAPKKGRRDDLVALLAELARRIRAEPGRHCC